MNNNIVKGIASCLAFFCAYILVDYLIDKNIDWSFALGCTFGYTVFIIFSIIIDNKKKK